MIPKPQEMLKDYYFDDLKKIMIQSIMREYGRRLLDHVAEVAELNHSEIPIELGGGTHFYVDKQSILKIKDEL
jgi:hypothetical protein